MVIVEFVLCVVKDIQLKIICINMKEHYIVIIMVYMLLS